ncbi:MAG: type I-E CRISPR-associated protein Cas7/Cse4/CasC [Desulfobacteraceae bacterium]|nr:type I-E CRISPR-associated protein Cas7/Cse4/CasC [Desulfobacteraceae bacterium]
MNQTNTNPYRSLRVEFHILQSFPVTCLNRDDVGAPKSAMIGGAMRARVSSQCWKRYVRMALHENGVKLGSRTKLIKKLIANACRELKATEDQAAACAEKVEKVFIKNADSDGAEDKSDTLLFLNEAEVRSIAEAFCGKGFDPDQVIKQKDAKKQAKEVAALIGKKAYSEDGLDIALFGRMVAQAATLNVEAAASFAHAISTHKVTNEVEFFTALDDCQEEPGSAHMGSLEFNAATYYRYVSLDIGQLWENLAGQKIPEAVDAFVKALFLAVPGARQTTQSGACPWEFAKIFVRKGQRLQVPFETAVKAKDGGFLAPSKAALIDYLAKKEKLFGSLFGKIEGFTFGEDEEYNIDNLLQDIKNAIPVG